MYACHMRPHLENPDRQTKFLCAYCTNWVQNIYFSYQMNRVELLLKLFLKKFTADSTHGFLPCLIIRWREEPGFECFHFSLSDTLSAIRYIRWSESPQSVPEIFLKVVILWYSPAKVRNYGKETAPERQIVSLVP